MKTILFCSLLCCVSFANFEPQEEIPIFSASLEEVEGPEGKIESEFKYVLTMYQLINSKTHPSSFTLCRMCREEKCEKAEPVWECNKFFLTKQKEALRCKSVRYTGSAAVKNFDTDFSRGLIVDESEENDSCNEGTEWIDKSVWNVRTYRDGKIERAFVGYPHPVH